MQVDFSATPYNDMGSGKNKKKRETEFAAIDPNRHPKMRVVCEDTSVSPRVADFLQQEGLAADEVMAIDSGKRVELGEKEWAPVRERLFNVDAHATPRVIVLPGGAVFAEWRNKGGGMDGMLKYARVRAPAAPTTQAHLL